MILQALAGHYENLAKEGKVPRPGWCQAKVSYAIDLSADGEINGIFTLKEEKERGKKKVLVPKPMQVPEMVTRSSGVSANFLCDNSKYFLGIDRDGTNKRTVECFQAAKERHLSVLKNTEGDMARAICLYFEKWNPDGAAEHPKLREYIEELTEGGNLIFCMGKQYAQEDENIQAAWENERNRGENKADGICLVTGEKTEIVRIHRQIKGVPGAQSSGASLVSFNAPAFESYGKEQSYNAPVGKYAEFAYTTALNYLLNDREHAIQLGDSMIVFWSESGEKVYQDLFSMSVDDGLDNQDILRGVFQNLREHRPIVLERIELDTEQRFFILGLAPNAARLSVRFFYQDSFGKILENISAHYRRMEIVKPAWEEREYIGIWHMLMETVNLNSKNKTAIPNMAAMTLQAVISGGRYPESLYANTLIRIRAEQGRITWGRASIIKAYLIRNKEWKEGENYMELNEASKDTAYVLGRLFAVLESIQMDTNPGIKATIRDRYFNSACAAPASVFPVLFKLKNSHLKKLEREKASAKKYYEKLLTELMTKLEAFPKQLLLEAQGDFMLGYYHQMQKRYEKKEEK